MPLTIRSLSLAALTTLLSTASATSLAQPAQAPPLRAAPAQSCPAIPARPENPSDNAYAQGNYKHAEDLYGQDAAQHPQDPKLAAALIQTWLHEGETNQAAALAAKLLGANPDSAIALTAQAEVQLHQGQPWLALETLATAAKADPCYARIHFVRSRAYRIDSQYASERAEVQAAYDIDPTEADIRHAFLSTNQPAHEIEAIHDSLATMKDLDADTRQKVTKSMEDMMPLLSENNQTCQIVPTLTETTTFSLSTSYLDYKHIGGYQLEVQLPQTKAHLTVDTAASGLYISRAVADANNLTAAAGAPPGTVHADEIKIGGLEFKDCTVGVSETAFSGKSDGFIGTDIFSPWLVDLNQPAAKLTLSQLPAQAGIIPGNRPGSDAAHPLPAELQGFTPVYHRQQYLLVPVTLDSKARRLFVLDSGMRLSTMTSDVAHTVSTTKLNFTNPIQTVSGSTMQVYRDAFDFQFASLTLPHQEHILQFDPTAIEQSSGIQVAGLMGFDILHSMRMELDYRDGLVKFESPTLDSTPGSSRRNGLLTASNDREACAQEDDRVRPLNTTIQAKVTGLIDSAHLKPGSRITAELVSSWQTDNCILPEKSLLYGHVTESQSTRSPDSSTLSLVFDSGECEGHPRGALALSVIGIIAAPDAAEGLQSALPGQVAGGGRDISVSAAQIGSAYSDINLNPDGPPHTIKPGIVKDMPKVKLQPTAGPGCSAKITSTERSIHMGTGAQFIIAPAPSRATTGGQ